MPNATKKLLVLAVAGAGLWGAWSLGGNLLSEDAETQKTKWLVNHVWIERLPHDERDMIGHLALIKHRRGRIGITGRSSQWRHLIEGFKWGLEGQRLSVFFPQEQVKGQVKVRTWRCKNEAPEPFELCLEIESRNRKALFYSREDWVIEPHDAEASLHELADTTPELAGVFEHAIDEELVVEDLDVETYSPVEDPL